MTRHDDAEAVLIVLFLLGGQAQCARWQLPDPAAERWMLSSLLSQSRVLHRFWCAYSHAVCVERTCTSSTANCRTRRYRSFPVTRSSAVLNDAAIASADSSLDRAWAFHGSAGRAVNASSANRDVRICAAAPVTPVIRSTAATRSTWLRRRDSAFRCRRPMTTSMLHRCSAPA